MLTEKDIEFVGSGATSSAVAPTSGVALVWVIDGDCLYDLPVYKNYEYLFLDNDEVVDVSEEYPDNEGITIRFKKNGEALEDLNVSEYFGSILLSNPTVLDLLKYPYGRYVISPNAKFDGEKFIITNRNMEDLLPWYPKDIIDNGDNA
jgi:hypothetical protein